MTCRHLMGAVLLSGVILLAAPSASAMQCGSSVVGPGDQQQKVLDRCGRPSSVTQRYVEVGPPGDWRWHRAVVEQWVYNFGPNELMRMLELEGGVVIAEQTLGYGH
jgi:hypothetical protein